MGRHNFLILEINRHIAESLPYEGMVLDLGCGTAPYRTIILERAERYVGLDWPNSLHDQQNVDVFADVAHALPILSDTADTVVAFQVMEHLAEPERFLAECYRVLRPGGNIFITVPFMWHVHEAPYDYYRYTRYGLEYLFSKHSFREIHITENSGFWHMIGLKLNYHLKKYERGVLKPFVWGFWWSSQKLAPYLDRRNPQRHETVSYTLKAVK